MIDPAWVSARIEDVPVSLRAHIVEVVGGDSPAVVSVAHLKDSAERLLAEIIREGNAADPAYLLAADALITLACEALSEFDPEGLAEIR